MQGALPPELWRLIIECLDRDNTRICLFVSHAFHSIALPSVFRHVNLHFGIWELSDVASLRGLGSKAKGFTIRSWKILTKITTDPDFAVLVKSLAVYLFPGEDRSGEEDTLYPFALCLLLEAIRVLAPSLNSVSWFGYSLPIVMSTLAQCTGSTLQHLVIPFSVVLHNHDLLTSFTDLRSIIVDSGRPNEFVHLYQRDTWIMNVEQLTGFVRRNSSTLTHLSIVGDLAYSLLAPSFVGLQSLELRQEGGISALASVLQHCQSLRELTLLLSIMDVGFDVVDLTAAIAPGTLPHLTSFRLDLGDQPEDEDLCWDTIKTLVDFLKGKRSLRRLDVVPADLPPSRHTRGRRLQPLFDVLRELPALDTLALKLGEHCDANTVEHLDTCVPLGVRALRIGCLFYDIGLDDALLSLARRRNSLGYFHVLTFESGNTELKERLLNDPPRALRLYGDGPYLWDVPRPGSANEGRGTSEHWSALKTKFRTAEDFGDEDWEWLLRHRGARDYDFEFGNASGIPVAL
ncbi:uncharacterized protein BXZ73DRAFT_102910 [Epithele typhae]|uniref:uncharacterized protein n=1 Tax=Epithele typhae TaxID=378194 RepID=UPI0020081AC2|nr:uncharacterized protein BXZ73DRAFT_102910 [Epithele typhae]KAH9926655.1 hypothetical protein BXZ73DRAFT_102910 [Epithele typhae]